MATKTPRPTASATTPSLMLCMAWLNLGQLWAQTLVNLNNYWSRKLSEQPSTEVLLPFQFKW